MANMTFFDQDLHERTLHYWKHEAGNPTFYIESLLKDELDAARANDPSRLPDGDAPLDLLVIVLGYSPEPLLQSIVVHRPRHLLVVYSERYQQTSDDGTSTTRGPHQFADFQQLLPLLREPFPNLDLPVSLNPKGHKGCRTPVDVFNFLRRQLVPGLRDGTWQRDKVRVDITGAKKSMASGAYLFASFAGVPVTYVDFDRYYPGLGRPFGYTCRMDKLESPATGFQLEEWRRVRVLYERSAYGAMMGEIRHIQAAMVVEPDRFEPRELEAVRRLSTLAEVYRFWAEGDLGGAAGAWDRVDVCAKADGLALLPTAVSALHEEWPTPGERKNLLAGVRHLEFGGDVADLAKSLFGDPRRFWIYANDEREKIRRLIEHAEDYRSALLRAAGLSELLLKFRLVRSWLNEELAIRWQDGTEWLDLKQALEQVSPEGKIKLAELLGDHYMISPIIELLTARGRLPLEPRSRENPGPRAKIRRKKDAPIMEKFWTGEDDVGLPLQDSHPRILGRLRNKAIHFTVPVSKELAREALGHLDANLRELSGSDWVPSNARTSINFTPNWKDLCDACGIDFLPLTEESRND